MHRLVQGRCRVQAKQLLLSMAALIAIDNDYQVAMMAPTEILAEQHYNQCQKFIHPLGLKSNTCFGKTWQQSQRKRNTGSNSIWRDKFDCRYACFTRR